MPRSRNAAGMDRRTLLASAGALTVTAAGAAYALGPGSSPASAGPPATTEAPSRPVASRGPVDPYRRGTTLASAAEGEPGSGYRRLVAGKGWDRVVRKDFAEPSAAREARRTTLASFVQFTDLHVVDVQHPLRYEYLRAQTASAWRPQETLSVAGAISLVERVNALPGAPATGAPLDFVVTTGDNTDNNARSELDWFLTTMSGGRITPNTGGRHYEGVQDSGLDLYWQPEDAIRDADKKLGFPRLPGFLDAALQRLNSPGLNIPWYSTVGNHDQLPGGCYAAGDPLFAEFATGGRKLMTLPEAQGAALWKTVKKGGDPTGELFKDLLRTERRRMRAVTPDEARAPFTREEYLRAHLLDKHTGPGPYGHGYSEGNLETGTQYYAFRIADSVLGISLDTTDPAGHYEGSLGTAQLKWLEQQLTAHKHEHVVVFSHHTSKSMRNLLPDPARPDEKRHGGEEVLEVLGRHDCVLAWVNGHSHKNAITARDGFWEISTASHVDFPQLARIIEITDNQDGTVSLFTTLIESAAPYRTEHSDLSQTGLAAMYRELAFNAPGRRDTLTGDPEDRNTELVLRRR